jgi:hypothetical protein
MPEQSFVRWSYYNVGISSRKMAGARSHCLCSSCMSSTQVAWWMPAAIPRPVIVGRIIRTGDELVEAVYEAEEDEDDEYLSEPFR